MIKVVFLGTPAIGASALQSLINSDKIEVVAAVTTVDKSVGRSHSNLIPTPVAKLAESNGIKVIKTNSINKDIDELIKLGEFDYLLTCAFGQFLSNDVLALPKKKALNIHGSLLPEGRGGAPLHWSIITGKKETGISIMEMVSKMDAGDYYSQYKIDIKENDTVDDLFINMSKLIEDKSAIGLIEVDNGASATKQDEELVAFWMNVTRENAKVDFSKTNQEVNDQIRGLTSKPGAWTKLGNKVVKIHKSMIVETGAKPKNVGEIIDVNDSGLLVSCLNSIISIVELTIEGKKRKVITSSDREQFIGKVFE